MPYFSHFSTLIAKERQAEMDRQKQEISRLSAKERQALGRCEFGLYGSKHAPLFHYTLVKLTKSKPLSTKINTGDLVLISLGNPLSSNTTGTVIEKHPCDLIIAFDSPPPKWVYSSGIRIDLYGNDITYQRMLDNLEKFRTFNHPLKPLILGDRTSHQPKPIDFDPWNEDLNPSQRTAISAALGTRDIFLIHGPPGTGKTTTLVELIFQATQRNKRVLATAESNTAADNMLLKLAAYPDIKIVRVGHPARIVPGGEQFSLYAHFANRHEAQDIEIEWKQVNYLRQRQRKCLKPTKAKRRGMSKDQMKSRLKMKKGYRGLRIKEIGSMYDWFKLEEQIGELVRSLKAKERKVFQDIIRSADIVVTTNSTAASDLISDEYFDLAVIDEGSQQVEPSTLIPILRARRAIIAGDHHQLPPTVISREAEELKQTFFARFHASNPSSTHMLQIQYRMNEQILSFPRRKFYNDNLQSHHSVYAHSLRDIIVEMPAIISAVMSCDPVVFYDTTHGNADALEVHNQQSRSYENTYEARVTKQVVEELLQSGIKQQHIGVISPYQGQVRLIQDMLELSEIEVNSVDGFQGREKEVIILSLVRANEEKNIGFLSDLRRLNVAITRAKRKLVIVGHHETLSSHPVYEEWLGEVKRCANLITPTRDTA